MNFIASVRKLTKPAQHSNVIKAMSLHKVFVYGTLKKGEPNHHLFNDSNGQWKFISNATTADKYPLIIGTRYNIPFLLYNPNNGTNVKGEVYEVDDTMLTKLDELEEHPTFYVRELQPVRLVNETTVNCWIYFLKKFRPELLTQTYYENYSSKGSHGLAYLERYLREQNVPAKSEVFLE